MTYLRQGARLRAAADFVRQDAVFADIGTDHAYLPLFLLEEGRIRRAVCADIAEGPLAAARAHAQDTPYASRMSFHLGNGLDGLAEQGLTDIAICGMGGELIADILSRAPFVRDGAVRLILQPMTRQELLRRYLASHGFAITEERYAVDASRPYVTFCVHFSGECRTIGAEEAVLGASPERHLGEAAFALYVERHLAALTRAVRGKEQGGQACDEERAMLRALQAMQQRLHCGRIEP